MADGIIENPILNGPYDAPSRYFELGSTGVTGNIIDGRRRSESFVPVAQPRRGAADEQQSIDFADGERIEPHELINDIRYEVDLWRQRGYPGVTPISRKLLNYWADVTRENRVMFCQREAAETAIFLSEVAGRHDHRNFWSKLDKHNADHNAGLGRVALKMATGTGKTVVMAMLIAWQTINKVWYPRDARFSKRFLVVTPGITIRNRLQVIVPNNGDNYYRQRDLVPAELWPALDSSEIIITNYHAFLPRTVKEMQNVAANTRQILLAGKTVDPFEETDDQIVSRVLRDFANKHRSSEIVVINDEAHHCYHNKPITDDDDIDIVDDSADKAARQDIDRRNNEARVWFKGLQAVDAKVGIKTVYDLSATPYYLRGSGYREAFIFPWTVSDFSLMDAIESGIVKVPRTPVDDDAVNELVTYRRLWDHVGDQLPKRKPKKVSPSAAGVGWVPPSALEGALKSLYRSYEKRFADYENTLAHLGEPPPVMIVVCPNTVVSKLVYDYIAGEEITTDTTTTAAGDDARGVRPGRLELLSNIVDGVRLARPRTILVDSVSLDSGEALTDDFKAATADEIAAFISDYLRRHRGVDASAVGDVDLLREVMNTVGKKGKLGEHVRCVVSVNMLTEGWDANTVTHILGVRAFSSQLLCEQVVGRSLRRRDYTVGDNGLFDAEYAEVYGVPFAFIPTDRPSPPAYPTPKISSVEVRSVAERAHLGIRFPRLVGYRHERPPDRLVGDWNTTFHVDNTKFATRTDVEGLVGEGVEHHLHTGDVRRQEVAYTLAGDVLSSGYLADDDKPIHTLFPQLVALTKSWLDSHVTFESGCGAETLITITEWRHRAVEHLVRGIRTDDVDSNRGGGQRRGIRFSIASTVSEPPIRCRSLPAKRRSKLTSRRSTRSP